MPVRYIVLNSDDIQGLEKLVNLHIEKWYKPIWWISVSNYQYVDRNDVYNATEYCQAMLYREWKNSLLY